MICSHTCCSHALSRSFVDSKWGTGSAVPCFIPYSPVRNRMLMDEKRQMIVVTIILGIRSRVSAFSV